MVRRSVVRPLMIGALVTGLGPLTGAGVGGAATEESPASVCSSMFGEQGPVDAPVAGEGPSGDPMPVTIAWKPSDWPAGLRDLITCVSIDGRAEPSLARAQGAPPNTGTFNFDLMLPPGAPGTLVCQQSVLIGAGSGGEQRRPTDAMCFRIRGADAPQAEQAAGPAGDSPAAPPDTPPARTHAPGPAETPPARAAGGAPPATAGPAPSARTTAGPPAPARPAAAQATPASTAGPAPGDGPRRVTEVAAGPRSAGHLVPGTWGSPWGRGALGTISRPSRGARAADGATTARTRAGEIARGTAQASAAAPATGAPGSEAPRAALARTGVADRIPLAAGGSLLALGGAAIVLAEPRRRTRPVPSR